MDKYVPKDIGNLRDIVDKGADYITYESPYAHAQYIGEVHGSPVRNYTTPRYGFILGQKNGKCWIHRCSKRGARICQ